MTSQIEHEASNLQGGQRNISRNDGHLPECFMSARLGVDTYAPDVLAQMKRAGCICDRLRACEERVRSEDDDYAYVAAQAEADGRWRGWSEALDAAWQAVAQECSTYPDLCGQCRANVYAIEALREQPADQTGYNLPDIP